MGWVQLSLFEDFTVEPVRPVKPKKDNEKILALQQKYKEGRKEMIKDLFLTIRSCAKRMIYHEREKKGFFITSEEVTEKATVAAEYIIEQYITRPDFILKVPSGYIYLRVLAALYRRRKMDELTSYTDREF